MNVKNGSKDLKKYSQISRRFRDTLARLFLVVFVASSRRRLLLSRGRLDFLAVRHDRRGDLLRRSFLRVVPTRRENNLWRENNLATAHGVAASAVRECFASPVGVSLSC